MGSIIGVASSTTIVNFPTEIYDLRIRPRDNTAQPKVNITSIAANAFENQTGITSINIPNSVTGIGASAFKNCTNLTTIQSLNSVQSIGTKAFEGCNLLANIYIPLGLTTIGDGAFAGCNNLNITVEESNPNYSAQDNILYNKSKTKIVASGKVASNVAISKIVAEISPHAFNGNINLNILEFENNPIIGDYAFDNCSFLQSVYFNSYDIPTLGLNSFQINASHEFLLYVPKNSQQLYIEAFADYPSLVDSLTFLFVFVSDGLIVQEWTVDYGSTLGTLPIPTKTGNDFGGWFDNSNFEGSPYTSGDLFEKKYNTYAYAKWTPRQYTITLDANGGIFKSGSTQFIVTYGEKFSISANVEKIGSDIEGWYDSSDKMYATANGDGTVLWDKTEDAILKVKWKIKNYEIQINDNGSITWLGPQGGLSDNQCTIEYGTLINSINLIAIFKNSAEGYRVGKIFDHFEHNGSNMNWVSVPDLGPTGSIVTITPIWINELHTIYFNTLTNTTVPKIEEYYSLSIQLPSQVNCIGYTFLGWYTSASGGTRVTWTTMPDLTAKTNDNTYSQAQNNGSVTLYARWIENTYYIAYNSNGGSGDMIPSKHIYGSAKTLSTNDFTKIGKRFTGGHFQSQVA